MQRVRFRTRTEVRLPNEGFMRFVLPKDSYFGFHTNLGDCFQAIPKFGVASTESEREGEMRKVCGLPDRRGSLAFAGGSGTAVRARASLFYQLRNI